MQEAFIKWLVPFLCGAAVSAIGAVYATIKANRKKDKERNDAMAMGIQCLLRAEIIRSAEKYIKRRYCPIYAKEALKREYSSYHKLGGNDVATALYEETMELPEFPPEERDNAE